MLEIGVALFSVLLTLATLASLVKWDDWWVRVFDFPRLQISTLIIAGLVLSSLTYDFSEIWHYLGVVALAGSLTYQGFKIFPYTVFKREQVKRYSGSDDQESISILVSNVLTPNRQAQKLVEMVRLQQPDLLLTLESDRWWESQLEVLEEDYPYSVKIPLDNLYGMHLYSKIELIDPKINYLVREDIPSIETKIRLDSGDLVRIYCLHPMPPSPTESETSTSRDAEILLVGKKLRNKQEPVLVFGDLNDVAWSYTTKLFQQISGLLDPRIGRGFFNTFHAQYPFLRWPLDHVFHSARFELMEFSRLPNMGSDHFPIYTKLYLKKNPPLNHEKPTADSEEKQEVREKIRDADPILKSYPQ